jgi:TnpA family transposase
MAKLWHAEAIRTNFLLLNLGSVDLRRAIGAAANKSEHFNRYAQWVSFGSGGLVTAAGRDDQRKAVKYNYLVANLLHLPHRCVHDTCAGGHPRRRAT